MLHSKKILLLICFALPQTDFFPSDFKPLYMNMTRIDIPLTFAVVFLLSTLGTRLEIELLGLVVCLLVPHRDAIGLQHGEIPENEMGRIDI